jgi:hypothetical protein
MLLLKARCFDGVVKCLVLTLQTMKIFVHVIVIWKHVKLILCVVKRA